MDARRLLRNIEHAWIELDSYDAIKQLPSVFAVESLVKGLQGGNNMPVLSHGLQAFLHQESNGAFSSASASKGTRKKEQRKNANVILHIKG